IAALRKLHEQFPKEGLIICFVAYSMAANGDFEDALVELDHARALGTEPSSIQGLPVKQIQAVAHRRKLQRNFGFGLLGFGGFYAVAIGLMAVAGWKRLKQPTPAPAAPPSDTGTSAPSGGYRLALSGGVLLFQVAVVLFVVLLAASFAGLLFLMLSSPDL